MKDKKKFINDIILITSLLLVAAVALIILAFRNVKNNLVAKIYVQNHVVEVVDLSKRAEKDIYIDGLNGKLHIHTRDGAIAVLESNCPHQDCVHMGYVKDSNHPIICAYNAVCISIEGGSNSSSYDVEI